MPKTQPPSPALLKAKKANWSIFQMKGMESQIENILSEQRVNTHASDALHQALQHIRSAIKLQKAG